MSVASGMTAVPRTFGSRALVAVVALAIACGPVLATHAAHDAVVADCTSPEHQVRAIGVAVSGGVLKAIRLVYRDGSSASYDSYSREEPNILEELAEDESIVNLHQWPGPYGGWLAPGMAVRFFVQSSAGAIRTITMGSVPVDLDAVEVTPSGRFSAGTNDRIYDLETTADSYGELTLTGVKRCLPYTCGGRALGSIEKIEARQTQDFVITNQNFKEVSALRLVYRPSTLRFDQVLGCGNGGGPETTTATYLVASELLVGVRQRADTDPTAKLIFGAKLEFFIYHTNRPASQLWANQNPRVFNVYDWRGQYSDTNYYVDSVVTFEHFVDNYTNTPTDEIVALNFTGLDSSCGGYLQSPSAISVQPAAVESGCPSPPPTLPPPPSAAKPARRTSAAGLWRGGHLPAERVVRRLCEKHRRARLVRR
jgi:hypothetical protein